MLISFVDVLLNFAAQIGYWGIVLLMTLESSFIPFPSELVIPPAAYLAAQGQLNICLIILAGVAGSILGAVFNYFLAYYLGRPLIYRLAKKPWARFLLISDKQIAKAEYFFNRYDRASTFFGRLVPVVRQLISLPAGFVRMSLSRFIVYTFLGSLIWSAVLAALGYFFGANEELWHSYYQEISWIIIIFAMLLAFYLIYRRREK
jgi:membrane protein DedA with SNARE-associated domain